MAEPTEAACWPAPAKLNLFLRVTGRRDDGYHELETLFQLLDWGDTIRVAVREDGSIARSAANYDVPEHQDIACRAAVALQARTGCALGADIKVHKRIPMGSGLGGGSSDAATVLRVLNELWGTGLSTEDLAGIGLELGADVPVFVHGRSALARGIGERLTPRRVGSRHYVIVMPGIEVSTAAVFAAIRPSRPTAAADTGKEAPVNDCEKVALRIFPELEHVRRALLEVAPDGRPRMTGTGSAFFAEMTGKEAAEAAAARLNCRYNVVAARGVDRSPLLDSLTRKSAGT